jgi:hypothetical protein
MGYINLLALGDDVFGPLGFIPGYPRPDPCRPPSRAFPENSDWPTNSGWKQLNTSLEGALLKSVLLTSVFYVGPLQDVIKCKNVLRMVSTTRIWMTLSRYELTSPMEIYVLQ